jgi:hypothetical protein
MNFIEPRCGVRTLAFLSAILLVPGDLLSYAHYSQAAAAGRPSAGQTEKKLTSEQLDSLVAPIALYPDPLLAQVLAASTYPIQVIEASRWLQKNPSLQGKQLVQAAAEQDWEASIQALVVFPSVLQRMSDGLQWTSSLGNAFLAQEQDVMLAVQHMRATAHQAGSLYSNSQQKVVTKTADGQKVIVIEPSNPQVIYVPTYNPTVAYGAAPAYAPYPAVVYPSIGAVAAASAVAFGTGIMLASAFNGCCGSAGWGWGFNWGARPTLYVNSAFIGRYGFARPIATPYGGWMHNPYYRGPVPYSSAAVAGRYGYGRAVATPYGTAAAVHTPYGSAGAVSGYRGAAAGYRTPYRSGGAVATPYGIAKGVRTPHGSAAMMSSSNAVATGVRTWNGSVGAVATPYGNAAAVRTPDGSGITTWTGATHGGDRSWRGSDNSDWAGSRSFGGSEYSRFGGFGGAALGGDMARAASMRGFSSRGGYGGRWGGGGFRRR